MLRPTETPRGNPVNPHCALIFCAFNRRKNNSLLDWMDMWRTLVEGRCKNMFWDQNVTINYCVSSQIPKGEKIGRRSFKETKQRFCSEESSCCGHQGAALFGGTDEKCLRNEIIIDFQPKSSNDNRRFSLSLTFLIRSRFDLLISETFIPEAS